MFNFVHPLMNDFCVTNISKGEIIWRLSYVDIDAWMIDFAPIYFILQHRHSKEFNRICNQTTDAGTPIPNLSDDKPVGIGNYEVSGMLYYGYNKDERIGGPYYVPVSIPINIKPR